MENVNLTPKDIVNKNFKPKMRGYDPTEVDEFLDMVIQDYENFNKETQRLQVENDRLVAKVDELTKQLAVGNSGKTAQPTSSTTNMDILKRLSNLERHVFGAQLNGDNNQTNRF
ncbi:cell division regulator GpsB [Ligilactobacillus agilis]|nr:cell division regulator GpsB [Ligilactobacillus agilis]ASR40813.1 cell division protein GpsB [Ligilactobacillus agilis]MBL1056891.1 cell division regulator GpsB [Ligilactobacillus agilis]MBM6762837.1 cell division regulator GpsB [Ligilactobacillus agilis]MBM6772341.1 cell division regulator GpsB [Ligilactobacillus agilis]MCL8205333.1 cell division regulator GpsB [Ligilactobacillus agilis]